jgi:hypothetical protein
MSIKKMTEAKLDGWEGPFFPKSLTALHETPLTSCGITTVEFFEACESAEGFTEANENLSTSDGYVWPLQLVFTLASGSALCVLVPDLNDEREEGGYSTDRHLALYFKGSVPSVAADEVLDELVGNYNSLRAAA